MLDNSANTRLAKNSVFMSIRMVIVLIISLYTTRVILKTLGVEDYGVYNVVAGFVSMFSFLNSSLSGAVQRFFNFELGKNGQQGANKVFSVSLVLHVILAFVTCIATESIGLWYLHNKIVLPEGRLFAAESIFHFSVISLFFTIVNTPFMAAVMAHEKMNFYALLEVLRAFLNLGIAFLLPYITKDKLIWYGGYHLGVSVLFFALYVAYSKVKFEEIYFNRNISVPLFKDLLSFSGWNVLGSLSYMLRDQGVNLVLNSFFGTIINAARGVSNQVNGALQSFVTSIVAPSRPQIIQSYSQSNIQRAWNLTFGMSKLSFLLYYAMSLPICIEIEYILHLWLGVSVPLHTSNFIIILLITNTFGTLVQPLYIIVQATGEIKFYQIVCSLSNMLTVPLAYLFLRLEDVPEYAYVALFITMSTNLLMGLISAKKSAGLKITIYFKDIIIKVLKVMVLTIPLSLLPILFLEDGLLRFIIIITVVPAIVAVTSYYLALNEYERIFFKQLIAKILKRETNE